MSFGGIGRLANDVSKALSADVPTFYRLDQTFGKEAGVQWLYSHLKNLLTTSGILKERMSNEQVDILASIITANYPAMTLTEFMLFESRFLGGCYEEFYGETSYVMAITRSLQRFKKDLNDIYAQIERETPVTVDPAMELRHKAECRWWECQKDLIERCPDAEGKELFSRISFLNYGGEKKSLLLSATSPDYDLLSERYKNMFVDAVIKYFPHVRIQCKVLAQQPNITNKTMEE